MVTARKAIKEAGASQQGALERFMAVASLAETLPDVVDVSRDTDEEASLMERPAQVLSGPAEAEDSQSNLNIHMMPPPTHPPLSPSVHDWL